MPRGGDGGGSEVESYIRTRLVITGASMIQTKQNFPATDSTCAGTPDYTLVEDVEFVVGNDVTTPAGAKEFDYIFNSMTATLQSANVVTYFNQEAMCGLTDWVINVARDVTTLTCGGDTANNAPIYDIYDVDGTTLKFGEEDNTHDRYTAAKRPVALATTEMVFTKQ